MLFLVVYACISLFPLELVIPYSSRDYVFLLVYHAFFLVIKHNCVFLNFLFCSVSFSNHPCVIIMLFLKRLQSYLLLQICNFELRIFLNKEKIRFKGISVWLIPGAPLSSRGRSVSRCEHELESQRSLGPPATEQGWRGVWAEVRLTAITPELPITRRHGGRGQSC